MSYKYVYLFFGSAIPAYLAKDIGSDSRNFEGGI
jgi:hypothetical protein